jgi:hypothetical protein
MEIENCSGGADGVGWDMALIRWAMDGIGLFLGRVGCGSIKGGGSVSSRLLLMLLWIGVSNEMNLPISLLFSSFLSSNRVRLRW